MKRKKYLLIILCSILLIIIIILSCLLYIEISKNKKYIQTINYLIDDNFTQAKKYIETETLYSDINYDLLVEKVNNPPQRIYDAINDKFYVDWNYEQNRNRFEN